jgi:two-component system, LytTR family, sensor kinase
MTAAKAAARTRRWGWIAALWCAGAVFVASQSIVIRHLEGRHWEEIRLFATEFAVWLPWILATPLVIGLARRFPIHRGPTVRGLAAHLAAWIVISITVGAWSAGLQVLFNPWGHARAPAFWETWSTTQFFQALNSLAAYVLILTITYLVDARDKVARQAAETARLGEELSNAQLAALRRQLEPHFMFNTLNSIAGLVRDKRNDAAVNMIVGLSELLRRASEDSHRPQVSLGEEAEYLQRYLDIQKLRLGERLRISVDIPADLLDAQAPSLLLQPLVENAIKHGVATRVAGGAVRVTAARQDGRLVLSVYNDGPGFPPDWQTDGAGVGLSNLRKRLCILYGDASELRMDRAGDDGVEVVVTLPLAQA